MSPEASAAVVDGAPDTGTRGTLVWLLALVPLVLLGALLAAIIGLGPSRLIQGAGVPPVERLAITRVQLTPGEIRLTVLNDGPDAVTIAQVVVDDAFWAFEAKPSSQLQNLERATVTVPYPWVHGETHLVKLAVSLI